MEYQKHKKFVNKNSDNIVLFENSLSKKRDKWLLEAESRIILLKEEVYHFLSNRDINNRTERHRQHNTRARKNTDCAHNFVRVFPRPEILPSFLLPHHHLQRRLHRQVARIIIIVRAGVASPFCYLRLVWQQGIIATD